MTSSISRRDQIYRFPRSRTPPTLYATTTCLKRLSASGRSTLCPVTHGKSGSDGFERAGRRRHRSQQRDRQSNRTRTGGGRGEPSSRRAQGGGARVGRQKRG